MSLYFLTVEISPMSHIDFKKWLCRHIEFKGQGPYKKDVSRIFTSWHLGEGEKYSVPGSSYSSSTGGTKAFPYFIEIIKMRVYKHSNISCVKCKPLKCRNGVSPLSLKVFFIWEKKVAKMQNYLHSKKDFNTLQSVIYQIYLLIKKGIPGIALLK